MRTYNYDYSVYELAVSFLEDTAAWEFLTKEEAERHAKEMAQDIQDEIEKYIDWYRLDDAGNYGQP